MGSRKIRSIRSSRDVSGRIGKPYNLKKGFIHAGCSVTSKRISHAETDDVIGFSEVELESDSTSKEPDEYAKEADETAEEEEQESQ